MSERHDAIILPSAQVELTFTNADDVLNGYGHVSGFSFADGMQRITITLTKDGGQVTLVSEMDSWVAHRTGQEDDTPLGHEELAALVADKGKVDEVNDAFDDLWQVATAVVEQITGHVIDSVADDIGRLLDAHTTALVF